MNTDLYRFVDDDHHTYFEDSIMTAFQLATASGPLCAEPMEGVAVFLESVTFPEIQDPNGLQEALPGLVSRLSGQIMNSMRENIRSSFLDWSPRLLLAMYSCDIQAPAEVLGKVYSVIAQRRGRIVSEEMKEGTPFFSVLAKLPVAESFGFAEDVRKRSSGAASPQLIFAGFEMLDEDPFWVPSTEEELEDLGDIAERENIAKRYMDAIRRRKGLFIEEKLVKNAEKQRTLKK